MTSPRTITHTVPVVESRLRLRDSTHSAMGAQRTLRSKSFPFEELYCCTSAGLLTFG